MDTITRNQLFGIANQSYGQRLSGQPTQGIELASDYQNYEIGARLQLSNRVYHYAMAGATLNPGMGAKVKNPQDVSQELIGANAAAGSTQIVLRLDNTDGPSYNGLLPANYLRGGIVVVFAAAGTFVRGILGNTAVTVNAGTATFTVTLDAPTPVAILTTDVAEAMASPYANVVAAADCHIATGFCTTVGVPTVAATVGQYLWVQTWGPCWVSPHALVGASDSDKAVYMMGDGSFGDGNEDNPGGIKQGLQAQYAGFVLANDKATGQGAPFVMLMIDP